MKDIFISFISSGWFVYSMYLYLFLLLVYIVYSTMNYFKYYSRMQKTLQSIYIQMGETERARAEAERQQRDIHGEGVKQDWLGKLDEELAYSGIKDKLKWMTTEIYLIIVILTVTVLTTAVTVITGPAYGVMTAILTVVGFKMFIIIITNRRDRKTDQLLLQFMNIVDNFSKTSDDLINIFDKSYRYLEEPLRGQIFNAVQTARNTGDTLLALQELQNNVKNKHFKVLIRNLEISSRFENNYSDIIEDCREIFHNYIKAQKEKRSIKINGIMEIFAMLVTGIISIYMIGQMTEEGNIVKMLLNGGTTGLAIFWGVVAVILISIYIMIFQIIDNKDIK